MLYAHPHPNGGVMARPRQPRPSLRACSADQAAPTAREGRASASGRGAGCARDVQHVEPVGSRHQRHTGPRSAQRAARPSGPDCRRDVLQERLLPPIRSIDRTSRGSSRPAPRSSRASGRSLSAMMVSVGPRSVTRSWPYGSRGPVLDRATVSPWAWADRAVIFRCAWFALAELRRWPSGFPASGHQQSYCRDCQSGDEKARPRERSFRDMGALSLVRLGLVLLLRKQQSRPGWFRAPATPRAHESRRRPEDARFAWLSADELGSDGQR